MSRTIVAAVLAAVVGIAVYGCGGPSPGGGSGTGVAKQQPSKSEGSLVGYWRGEKEGGPCNLHFASDGTGWVSETGEKWDLEWKVTGQRLAIKVVEPGAGPAWDSLSGEYDWAGSTLVIYHEYRFPREVKIVPSFYSRVE
jgi:hypothetical protein